MSYFTGSQGRIFHDRWLPPTHIRGVVVVLHGYGEHLGLYAPLAQRLTTAGYAVYAMDAIGHGRSEGQRAVVSSWDHYVDDARTLVGLARADYPGRPVAVIGHSAGANAALLLTQRHPAVAQALILSGAPISAIEWIQAELAAGLSETDATDPTEWLSTHPDYIHALLTDPLVWKGGFRRETLHALSATWPEIANALSTGRPAIPTLFLHGDADPVVDVASVREVAGHLPHASVRTFSGDLHDVLNEHDRDRVHDVVAEFLQHSLMPLPQAAVVGQFSGTL